MIKKALFIGLIAVLLLAIYLLVKHSIPREETMQTQDITIDSIAVTGPVVFIYNKPSRENFWLKSYTTFDATEFDSLKGRPVRIHYMKAFAGPFENRIFKIETGSGVVFEQADKD